MVATVTVIKPFTELSNWTWRLHVNGRVVMDGKSPSYEGAWADGIAALVFQRGNKVVERKEVDTDDGLESSVGAPD